MKVTRTEDYTNIAKRQWAAMHGVHPNDVSLWIDGKMEIGPGYERGRTRKWQELPESDPDRAKGTFIRAVRAGDIEDGWEGLLQVYELTKAEKTPDWFQRHYGVIVNGELILFAEVKNTTPAKKGPTVDEALQIVTHLLEDVAEQPERLEAAIESAYAQFNRLFGKGK